MKRLFTIWKCIFLHKKEVRLLSLPDHTFNFEIGRYKGCRECDVWRRIDD